MAELRKAKYNTHTVFPIPGDDEFSVTMRKIPPGEVSRIQDKHGYNDKGGRTQVRLQKVLEDTVCAAVVSVNGGTEEGVPLDPVARETKLRLLTTKIDIDGEESSLWGRCDFLFGEKEKEAEKNTPGV